MTRHSWAHPKRHVYVCAKCGTAKVNRYDADAGVWESWFYRPDAAQTAVRDTRVPPCEPGPWTERYLAKYGVERKVA